MPCAVTEGDPPLKLRWILNGHTISPHSGISVLDLGGRGAILSIGSVQATHAGTYTCIAENSAGRHELSADLIVNGVLYSRFSRFLKFISNISHSISVFVIFHIPYASYIYLFI